MRTASSASTRLRLSARSRPISSAVPESFTSAFGALATIAWSRSLTMMSRMRTAMRILPARSICVPPTSTVLPWPIFSSIAAASHGVAISRLIGPAPSRHHSPPKHLRRSPSTTAITTAEALYPAFTREPSAQRCEAIAEPMQTGIRSRQQPARAMARRLVMVLIPIGIIPLRELDRQRADWVPGATYSLPLPLGAGADCKIDRRQALPVDT